MEFFEGWKALNSRFDSDNPTAMTQLIGYKLLAIDNERHHPDEFSVSDRDLMKRTGIQSTQTIHAARNTLKQMGLIDFETPKGKPTQYRWTINQTPIKHSIKHSSNTNQTLEANSYIRVREDIKDVKTKNQSIASAKEVEELDALLDYWAGLGGGRLSFEHQSKLSAQLKEHGLDWLKAAMKDASDANNNPRSLSPKFLFSVIARKDKAAAPEKPAPKKSPPLNDYEALRQKLLGGD